MDPKITVTRHTYAGLFCVTLATLMYEILLTRLFSVTMWYHFAFLAVSVALFGMTVGAILVYLCPDRFRPERGPAQLASYSLGFAVTVVLSFLTHLSVPFASAGDIPILQSAFAMLLTFVAIAVPFVYSGICVCIALTRFPQHISKLYAADLLGAAAGCVVLTHVLRITDGPTTVFVIALLAAVGAAAFAAGAGDRGLLRTSRLLAVALGEFAAINTLCSHQQAGLIRLVWVKGDREAKPLYEKWNSFSRIAVFGDADQPCPAIGWGLSRRLPTQMRRQLLMNIDATAGTVLTHYTGDLADVEYLKADVTNIGHYLRRNARVLVVGVGGGRDVLSALAFRQRSVLGVEINGDILRILSGKMGEFTGHLDRDPRVSLVNDEARSYITRSKDTFDIIQLSLIDTWAATAAGAFVLSENSLYTVEAWECFLNRLTPRGIVSVSRWHFRDRPGEMYRAASLAAQALSRIGVANPRAHLLIAALVAPKGPGSIPDGVGTVLVSRSPFSREDVATLQQVASRLGFRVILTPTYAADPAFARITSNTERERFIAGYPLDISAPTDDRPFFFHTLRFRDALHPGRMPQGEMDHNIRAVSTLFGLLVVVLLLTLSCIVVPLGLTTRKGALSGAGPFFVFFGAIGLGFMFVEISQMQRLTVFLGHPVYGLSVMLFTLLLSSGIGSYATGRGDGQIRSSSLRTRFAVLLAVLVLSGLVTGHLVELLRAASTPIRILASVGLLFPLGLVMGAAFPLGMKAASTRFAALTPWFWGINGATSVCAAVVAVVVAMNWGISTSFWVGVACYVVASAALVGGARAAGEREGE